MNVATIYGQTEIVTVCGVETTGFKWLSYYTKETLPRDKKLDAEIEAGRCLKHVRR